ncbi:DegT/DnrJ/EryC1/StrS family aminotransferase [Mucisphaera calidilacus]|uniref:UDP-4-amino-4-deoxy-L-arabinose--oxoglutarate aminotransferase n=1 Tax=Mucisphaera calidilacus TaxID=2527982 RepID=A0A518BU55_9BACT|nr:DegT/DnrJ/EryC1/StrS family aminotransferase [Mucisphaera calidilacus]QDU70491.1 UDP-4-amino-4-deoxy-L-arabinose--oxoglutarate aminotransferase [Mucisphaera calidilacus]
MSGRYRVPEHPRGFICGEEEERAVLDAIRHGGSLSYAGPNLPAFEREFADYVGVDHAIAVANCTVGLFVAAQALRLGVGDEVIMTPQTFRATAAGLIIKGVRICFADIDDSLNLDPETIESLITERTKAVFVTHMHGNPADMPRILEIARARGLYVVEDAAHAPGATCDGVCVGGFGDLTVFSFHSLKNMSTGGEGGMITARDRSLADACRALRTMGVHGDLVSRETRGFGRYAKPDFYYNDHSGGAFDAYYRPGYELGMNMRLSDLQAAFGRVQLRRLDAMNATRARIAARYDDVVRDLPVFNRFEPRRGDRCVYHLYPLRLNTDVCGWSRDEVVRYLQEDRGIEMLLRYFPVHLSEYMQHAGYRLGACPVCERIYFEEMINLPISPNLTEEQIDWVCGSLVEVNRRAVSAGHLTR